MGAEESTPGGSGRRKTRPWDHLRHGGLRWRLTAWVAVVMLLFAAVIFVAVYHGTGTELRHQIDHELAGDASELAHNLQLVDRAAPGGRASPHSLSVAATRYVNDQPFGASSTLLFASVPGAGTSTNQPELLGLATPDNDETAAEQDQENLLALGALHARDGYSTLPFPDIGDLRLLKRRVAVGRSPGVTIGVGEPLQTVRRAQHGIARAFLLAGALALAAALLASYLVGARVSRPLRRMAAIAARVDAGELEPRIHEAGGPGNEVRVLADSFNHMLDRLSAAFAGQRAFVADASHELRTPLTIVRGQLEVLAAQPNPPLVEVRRVERLVQAEVSRITRLVDDLLLLAKSEERQFLHVEPIDLGPFIEDLWDGMSLTAERRFELSEVPAGTLRADPDRLAQALRNLARNAIEHTSSPHGLVRLDVAPGADGRVRFSVSDDGPGIPADQRERVFDRFHRTDAARDRASGGTGLGLAIVQAIVTAHAGRILAAERPGGGARVELELPGFTRAPRRGPAVDSDGGPAAASDPPPHAARPGHRAW
jgi:two-component system OmpR family sensor kinase